MVKDCVAQDCLNLANKRGLPFSLPPSTSVLLIQERLWIFLMMKTCYWWQDYLFREKHFDWLVAWFLNRCIWHKVGTKHELIKAPNKNQNWEIHNIKKSQKDKHLLLSHIWALLKDRHYFQMLFQKSAKKCLTSHHFRYL